MFLQSQQQTTTWKLCFKSLAIPRNSWDISSSNKIVTSSSTCTCASTFPDSTFCAPYKTMLLEHIIRATLTAPSGRRSLKTSGFSPRVAVPTQRLRKLFTSAFRGYSPTTLVNTTTSWRARTSVSPPITPWRWTHKLSSKCSKIYSCPTKNSYNSFGPRNSGRMSNL